MQASRRIGADVRTTLKAYARSSTKEDYVFIVFERLGIGIERIHPGHPQQNGLHERMHLTLKKATKPAAPNFLQQQARFDKFIGIFNNQRPHEALDMQCPAEFYQPSQRIYTGLPDIAYPFHDKTIPTSFLT